MRAILTTVGTNDFLSELVSCAATCWDWPRLVHQPPNVDDARAFRLLAESLRPCLEHAAFPLGIAEFRNVPRAWPRADELCIQYARLCARTTFGPLRFWVTAVPIR